ncbi:TonB-dependent receptor [Opitutaceae bacterium EW11]|nr:TonB-dependent receptor [Opitutaceae bacterium EW11]
MKTSLFAVLGAVSAASVLAEEAAPVDLPQVTVYSPRVALQEPVATFAMPVSSLRYEPLVDVQARNLAEGQADVAIRGGIFEESGFRIGAVPLYDPQTGHYFAEIPVSPSMLGAPSIITGADNASRGWNANAGSIAYGWRPIRTAGMASVSGGDYDTWRGELYQGYASDVSVLGRKLAVDASVASSQSDGSQPWGEHRFTRINARVQLANELSQSDLFFGYQHKTFGWPNLYTPFANVFETEDLKTQLLAFNHRVDLGGDDFVNVGAYYRYNKDHYVFNRADPGAHNPAFATGPAFHRTWVYGAGAEGSVTWATVRWNFAATWIDDELSSTSLIYGRYRTRSQEKLSLVPEKSWTLSSGPTLTAKAGVTYDDSNRDASSVSPVAELSLDHFASGSGLSRLYVSYARSTQTPTYTALNSNATRGLFRGNPNLQRQIARNVEIGAQAGAGPWTTTAAVFYRKDDRLVDWTYSFASTNARAANPVDIGTTGFELVTRYTTKPLDVVFGYTAMHKSADYGTAAVDASFYALNYPEQRVTLAVTGRLGGGWELRMDNEYRIQEENRLRKSGRHPLISSAGVFYSVRQVPGLQVSLEVENLWNSDFEEVPAVPAAKRQISLGAVYSW